MKEIFEKMTGEWDWFKLKDSDEFEGGWDDIEKALYISYRCYKANCGCCDESDGKYYSLADLLANKSWCRAVWGTLAFTKMCTGCAIKSPPCDCTTEIPWEYYSLIAFETLLHDGEEACITYIKSTMV